MTDDKPAATAEPAMDARTPPEYSPSQWIYRNLTPWRIHACFRADRSLLPRCPAADATNTNDQDCGHDIVKVLSIPALGEVKVPKEDSYQYNTLKMRRLGQIEVRPAPSELWTNVPRAIVIFGWLLVALVFGALGTLRRRGERAAMAGSRGHGGGRAGGGPRRRRRSASSASTSASPSTGPPSSATTNSSATMTLPLARTSGPSKAWSWAAVSEASSTACPAMRPSSPC